MRRSPQIQMEGIRSLLPVATSALSKRSKRWQTSWAPVKVIDFSDRNLPTCPPPNGDHTAGSNTASKFVFGTPVRYGRVVPLSKNFDSSRVDDWMRYVERNRVKELELHFWWGGYTLPQFFYENPWFEKLNLTTVDLEPEGRINWPSLKTLFVDGLDLNEDLFHNILSGCPNLEELELSFVRRGDSGFKFYDFRSCSRLRKLVIDCDQNNDELRILAPTLESLEIIGEYEDYQIFKIITSPSCTHAKLDFYAGVIIDGFSGNYVNMMTQLLQSLSHVRDFFIGNWCIQVLSQAALCKGFSCPRSTRKCLILDTCLDKWNLPGIASLLESSPEVETLVINTLPEERSCGRRSYGNDCWKSSEVLNFLEQRGAKFLLHVKTVKIVGFQDYGLELRFIEFLLANTPILERMIIHPKRELLSVIPRSKDFDFSRMDDWMRYVERHRVKELELHFRWGGYTLPQFLYENPWFEKLHLTDVYFKHEGRINWPSLKTLFLDGLDLNEDLFHNIFSGCPNLEELKLRYVRRYDSGFKFYDFCSCSRLRKLVINCDQNNDELRILAPTLESLEIIGVYEDYQKFKIINSPSCTHAKLDIYAGVILDGFSGNYIIDGFFRNYVNMMTQLLQSLSHVRDFFIGNWCIQVLSKAALCKGFSCPRSTRKCLILDTCLDKWNLPGIASLLESSPEVETLVINTLPEKSRGNDCWKSSEVLNFLEQCGAKFLHHVKTVKIVGFRDYGLELRFIEFLLANSPILEKMIIHGKGEELSGISSRLSSFQKCSPDAIITGKSL